MGHEHTWRQRWMIHTDAQRGYLSPDERQRLVRLLSDPQTSARVPAEHRALVRPRKWRARLKGAIALVILLAAIHLVARLLS